MLWTRYHDIVITASYTVLLTPCITICDGDTTSNVTQNKRSVCAQHAEGHLDKYYQRDRRRLSRWLYDSDVGVRGGEEHSCTVFTRCAMRALTTRAPGLRPKDELQVYPPRCTLVARTTTSKQQMEHVCPWVYYIPLKGYITTHGITVEYTDCANNGYSHT